MKGATCSHGRQKLAQNFNPRSREGSDIELVRDDNRTFISIHAPVKGATKKDKQNFVQEVISIHAPVKGATAASRACLTIPKISIHAPVKGAT